MSSISRKQLLENRANRPNKFNIKRAEIAAATLEALAENGYAKTSLRDIASKADFSLGTLHYYFENKVELITYCVRTYKRQFVDDINALTDSVTTLEMLLEGFIKYFVHAVEIDNKAHCLWYDTRLQSLFDPSFRPVVQEVEAALHDMVARLLHRIGALVGHEVSMPEKRVYWLLDGMFQQYLQLALDDDDSSTAEFEAELRSLFASLL